MKDIKILDKSCMGFKLPDGGMFIISNDDIKNITSELYQHILLMQQERVFLIKDTGLERAKKLYEVYQAEKSQMNEKQKQSCLTKLIKYLTEDNYELDTLKRLVNEMPNKK